MEQNIKQCQDYALRLRRNYAVGVRNLGNQANFAHDTLRSRSA